MVVAVRKNGTEPGLLDFRMTHREVGFCVLTDNRLSDKMKLCFFLWQCARNKQVVIPGSSKGRTSGFGPEYRGSNPCPGAMKRAKSEPKGNTPQGISMPGNEMPSMLSREYQTLLAIEHWLAARLSRAIKGARIGRFFSAWFLFWITIGAFFFAFQSYLLLHSVSLPLAGQVELGALLVGVIIGVLVGFLVIVFFENEQTDWRIPMAIFGLWMIAPTIFPLLFIVGVFSGQPELIAAQTASWRPIVEFLIFGLGLAMIGYFYKHITFTQGAITVLLFSFIFIGKALTTNAFYLANKCPIEVSSGDFAWQSNTRAEIEAYRADARDDVFYQTPLGQLVCTRTQENLFR